MKNYGRTLLLGTIMASLALGVKAQIPANIDMEAISKQVNQLAEGEFQKMDKNNDGKISLAEYQEYIIQQTLVSSEKTFKQLDKNNDEAISADEYQDFMGMFTGQLGGMMKNLQSQKDQLEKINPQKKGLPK